MLYHLFASYDIISVSFALIFAWSNITNILESFMLIGTASSVSLDFTSTDTFKYLSVTSSKSRSNEMLSVLESKLSANTLFSPSVFISDLCCESFCPQYHLFSVVKSFTDEQLSNFSFTRIDVSGSGEAGGSITASLVVKTTVTSSAIFAPEIFSISLLITRLYVVFAARLLGTIVYTLPSNVPVQDTFSLLEVFVSLTVSVVNDDDFIGVLKSSDIDEMSDGILFQFSTTSLLLSYTLTLDVGKDGAL